MFDNLRQDLLEKMGEWLDSNTVKTEEILSGFDDNDEGLHIEMADAAIKVYAESRGLVFLS